MRHLVPKKYKSGEKVRCFHKPLHQYFYIYKIYVPETKCSYIGSTQDVIKRVRSHMSCHRNDKRWGSSENWVVTVIDVVKLKTPTIFTHNLPEVIVTEDHYITKLFNRNPQRCLNSLVRNKRNPFL